MKNILLVVGFIGALLAWNPSLALAQQSTCWATTAAPSYTNATLQKLSCDLSGNLRTSGSGGSGGGTSSNFGAAFPTAGTAVGAKDSGGVNMQPLNLDASGNLKVNVAAGGASGGTSSNFSASFPATGTAAGASNGTNMVPLLVDGSGNLKTTPQTATPAGANIIGKVGIDQTTPGTTNGVQINAALPAGSNIVGKIGIDQTTPGTTNGVVINAATTGGATAFHLIAANTNNSTLISTGAHTIFGAFTSNNNTTIAYLKFYDKSTAPTCGTDTPIFTLIIPASASGAGSNVEFPVGVGVTNGLGICVTTGIADNDNTSVAATTYTINVAYK